MSEPEKRKKIVSKIIWITVSSVVIFFYFVGLETTGRWYREKYPEPEEKQIQFPLNQGWKYMAGDSMSWASPLADDRSWAPVRPDSLGNTYKGGIAWFRLHFKTDTFAKAHPVALVMHHTGASEVYLDGEQLAAYGKVAPRTEEEKRYDPSHLFMTADLARADSHVLAVRYSNNHLGKAQGLESDLHPGFILHMADRDEVMQRRQSERYAELFNFSLGVFLLTLSLVHLLLYLFYRKAKENLFYSLFSFSYAMIFIAGGLSSITPDPQAAEWYRSIFLLFLNPFLFLTLLVFVFWVFQRRFPFGGWLALGVSTIGLSHVFFGWPGIGVYFISLIWFAVFSVITMGRGTLQALREKRPGAKIIGAGVGAFALLIFITISLMFFNTHLEFNLARANTLFLIVLVLGMMSIPISMSIYLAYTSASTSNNLQLKLAEVEKLSALTLEQEKEKQRILETQKETLERQVKERTVEIEEQKKVIEEKNKDITDSINYAKHIQEAILTSRETKYRLFSDAFVLFKPKDIVSGDFYWFAEQDGCRLIAACDCTGHGVPGALMSMIGNNILNQTVLERGITSPEQVLELLDKEVRRTLKQDKKSETKDGMDVALLTFRSGTEMDYAGAQRPLWIIRNGALEEIKANKFSIGGGQSEQEIKFRKHSFSLEKGTCVYIFSDGFADQFNREDKKLMTKRFKDILCGIQHLSMPEQENYLDEFIENWKGNLEQTDDILVIGIRI